MKTFVSEMKKGLEARGYTAKVRHQVLGDSDSSNRTDNYLITATRGDVRVQADISLVPDGDHYADFQAGKPLKYFLMSFFRASRLESHSWREIFSKSFVFSCQGGGGTPFNMIPISELTPASNLTN